jgi:hypothetical protein
MMNVHLNYLVFHDFSTDQTPKSFRNVAISRGTKYLTAGVTFLRNTDVITALPQEMWICLS